MLRIKNWGQTKDLLTFINMLSTQVKAEPREYTNEHSSFNKPYVPTTSELEISSSKNLSKRARARFERNRSDEDQDLKFLTVEQYFSADTSKDSKNDNIALSRENQSDDNNDEIQKSYEWKRRRRIAKLVNKEWRSKIAI